MEHNVVLTMRGITMTFPGVKALDNVDLTLRKGEIMALMGENGAGKSTLIKCLTGINAFDAGEIRVDLGSMDRWSIIRPWMHRKREYPRCIRKSIFARI